MLSFPARSMEKVLQKLHELVPHHEAQHPPGISNEKLKEQAQQHGDSKTWPKHVSLVEETEIFESSVQFLKISVLEQKSQHFTLTSNSWIHDQKHPTKSLNPS